MTDGTVDDAYLEWLYSEIGVIRNRNPARSYWSLAKQLLSTPYIWFVPNDDNRALDGLELRNEFVKETDLDVDDAWVSLECSVLEMLIALARRASFNSYGTPGDWFWKLLENLELKSYSDKAYNDAVQEWVSEVLERMMMRTYGEDGVGGIFPLRNAQQDQRTVELWYQMSAYLLEGDYLNNGPEL